MKITEFKPIIVGERIPGSLLTPKAIFGKNDRGDTLYQTNCACGGPFADRIVATAKYLRHNVLSCGCLRLGGTPGLQIGDLVLIAPTEERRGSNIVYLWRCTSCNRQIRNTLVQVRQLVHATCGLPNCRDRHLRFKLPPGRAVLNRIIARYRRAAEKAGLAFSIPEMGFFAMLTRNCHYCGRPPFRKSDTPGANGQLRWNGVDRCDNARGYVLGNTVSCCALCNFLKGPMASSVFLLHVRRIARNLQLLYQVTAGERRADQLRCQGIDDMEAFPTFVRAEGGDVSGTEETLCASHKLSLG